MKFLSLIPIMAFCAVMQTAAAAPQQRTCMVKHNGKNDSPAIMDAFEKCKDGGRVVFQKNFNYTLGEVITTPVLKNVEIDFDSYLIYPFNMVCSDICKE